MPWLPYMLTMYRLKKLEEKLASIENRLNIDANGNLKVNIVADSVGLVKSSDLPKDADGNIKINVSADSVGLAKSADLPKDANGNLKINVVGNDVGLATESTLSSLNSKIPSPTSSGNLPIAIAEDSVGIVKSGDLPKDTNGNLKINVVGNDAGLATESTLSSLNNKIPSPTSNGNLPIAVKEDGVGLVKSSDLPKDSSGNLKVNISAQDVKPLEIGLHKSTEQKLSSYSLAAGGSVNIDLTIPPGKSAFALIVKATYDASASAGIRIKIYWSPDGSNYDTDTDEVYDHPFEAGKTKQKTYIIHAVTPYVRVVIENLDSNYAVTLDTWVSYV